MKRVLIGLGIVAWLALGAWLLAFTMTGPLPFSPTLWIVFVVTIWIGFPLELFYFVRMVKEKRS